MPVDYVMVMMDDFGGEVAQKVSPTGTRKRMECEGLGQKDLKFQSLIYHVVNISNR
jgi:hypothetical protein